MLQNEIDEAQKDGDQHSALLAKVAILQIIGNMAARSAIEEFYRMAVLYALKKADPRAFNPQVAFSRYFQAWLSQFLELVAEASALGNPLVEADAMIGVAIMLLGVHLLFQGFLGPAKLPRLNLKAEMDLTERFVNKSISIYSAAQSMYDKTQAIMLLADYYKTIGRNEEAKNAAKEALLIAQANRYVKWEAYAWQHLKAETPIDESKQTAITMPSEDVILARLMDDSALIQMATDTAAALGLPRQAIENLVVEARGTKHEAELIIDWCRHIKLEPQIAYPSTACLWTAKCSRHGHRTRLAVIMHEDAANSFLESFCRDCTTSLDFHGGGFT